MSRGYVGRSTAASASAVALQVPKRVRSRGGSGLVWVETGGPEVKARYGLFIWLLATALWLGCRAAPGSPERDYDITPSDMRARIFFLASDRLRGRDTPSQGLDIAAGYIRSEFQRVGLEPPRGGYVQRYPLVMSEMGAGWSLTLRRGSRRAVLRQHSDFWGLPWAAGTVEGRLRFVGAEPPAATAVAGDPAVWMAYLRPDVMPRQWLSAAAAAGAVGLILVAPAELAPYLREWGWDDEVVYEMGDVEASLPGALVSEAAMAAALERLGLETQPAGGPPLHGEIDARAQLTADLRVEVFTAPNVLGILPGRDAELGEEYVLLSAHMDGLGVGVPVDGDSIYNGADDNASGTAAILEMAEAAAALRKRPRRSLAFLAVSGEEKGLLGSTAFVTQPPIPLERIVANINIDMIGRNWEDTIAVIGKPYSTLGMLADSVAAAHPELSMTVVGDIWPSDGFFFRSDQFSFARKGIPALFFFNGVHEDYHRPSDEAQKVKFRKAARITRLVFELALAIANAEEPPDWDPQARARIVGGDR